ncbi:hypothetical protein OAN307_c18130 [Octadecabacter antarcticus 307]|uniref:Uncharacterized protein n=1 Tax=Octadecabacter antarcticus 307 TaxID=391626 RepID=M9RAW3_9RHOB|nr:hypothetical protein [Octadecabacter antarcticus]AGI67471.1 hypothetical protein OAN307_c18130 [Octadecabacter antarcticus 307]
MTSQTSKTKLPAGFMDITPRVRSTICKRAKHLKIENDDGDVEYQELTYTKDQDKAVNYILYGVAKYKGEYLTCFTDNKPVLGNDLNTTVDACKMNTKALSRELIKHIIECTVNFQRYAYYPGVKRTAIMGHRNGCDIAQL